MKLETVKDAFERQDVASVSTTDETMDNFEEADAVVEVELEYTGPLLLAAFTALMPALQYGFNNGSMNTAADVMRRDLGIPVGTREADAAWGFCVSIFCIG